MAKRFTDTDKWKKPFIRGLKGAYKLLWFYILDDCNHAGIWEVDMEVASIRIGEEINQEEAEKIFGDRVQKISNNKWFLQDFIFFQYGTLNEKNRLHLSVIQILNKYGIKPLESPLEGVKYKDKDKDKEQYKDKEEGGVGETKSIVGQMCKVWYDAFPKYTSEKKNDFEGMGKVLLFIVNTADLKTIQDADTQIKILNTLQLIADQVNREPFWVNKPIKTIANNIQEFYNKIKNPQNGKQSAGQTGNLRTEVQGERDRRREERRQAAG